MSKYNLTDILEQYKIGSGWTDDFDFDGMLKAGMEIDLEDSIEKMKAVAEDFTDVNYHREAAHLYDAIDALEMEDDMDQARQKLSDFRDEIERTAKQQGMNLGYMDIEPTLGKFMKSRMEGKEAVDLSVEASQKKAGIKEDQFDGGDGYDEGNESFDVEVVGNIIDLIRENDIPAEYMMEEIGQEFGIPFQFGRASGMNEADAIGLEPGMPGEKTVNHDRKMAMANIMSVLGAEGVNQDEIFSFIKTHKDDIFSGDIDAHDKEDILMNYKEYFDINRDDFSDLQEHFGRFMKPFQ